MFRDERGVICSCNNDTSAIRGGRMSRTHGCVGVTMFRDERGVICSCNNDISAIRGGRMLRTQGCIGVTMP
jgi:hypothetical protein